MRAGDGESRVRGEEQWEYEMLEGFEIYSSRDIPCLRVIDLELARELIRGRAGHAVVLVTNGEARVEVEGERSGAAACKKAKTAFMHLYYSHRWIQPRQNVVAAINFDAQYAMVLAGSGVDLLLTTKRPPEFVRRGKWRNPGPAESIKNEWLGPNKLIELNTYRHNPLRALLWPKSERI